MNRYLLFISILFATCLVNAQDFISVDELSESQKKENYLIIDARGKTDYGSGHIKGAINVPFYELYKSEPYDGALFSPEEFAKKLGDYGIAADKNIVVYCSHGNASGRVYWTLKYMGAENVKMLDGNIGAWEEENKPLKKKSREQKIKPIFHPSVNSNILATLEEVEEAIASNSARLVDVRSESEFNDTDEDNGGHIEGAISLPSFWFREDDSKLKTKDTIVSILDDIGLNPEMHIILYGKTGTRTGFVFNVLTTVLDYPYVKVYEGSYNEWILYHKDEREF